MSHNGFVLVAQCPMSVVGHREAKEGKVTHRRAIWLEAKTLSFNQIHRGERIHSRNASSLTPNEILSSHREKINVITLLISISHTIHIQFQLNSAFKTLIHLPTQFRSSIRTQQAAPKTQFGRFVHSSQIIKSKAHK